MLPLAMLHVGCRVHLPMMLPPPLSFNLICPSCGPARRWAYVSRGLPCTGLTSRRELLTHGCRACPPAAMVLAVVSVETLRSLLWFPFGRWAFLLGSQG